MKKIRLLAMSILVSGQTLGATKEGYPGRFLKSLAKQESLEKELREFSLLIQQSRYNKQQRNRKRLEELAKNVSEMAKTIPTLNGTKVDFKRSTLCEDLKDNNRRKYHMDFIKKTLLLDHSILSNVDYDSLDKETIRYKIKLDEYKQELDDRIAFYLEYFHSSDLCQKYFLIDRVLETCLSLVVTQTSVLNLKRAKISAKK